MTNSGRHKVISSEKGVTCWTKTLRLKCLKTKGYGHLVHTRVLYSPPPLLLSPGCRADHPSPPAPGPPLPLPCSAAPPSLAGTSSWPFSLAEGWGLFLLQPTGGHHSYQRSLIEFWILNYFSISAWNLNSFMHLSWNAWGVALDNHHLEFCLLARVLQHTMLPKSTLVTLRLYYFFWAHLFSLLYIPSTNINSATKICSPLHFNWLTMYR